MSKGMSKGKGTPNHIDISIVDRYILYTAIERKNITHLGLGGYLGLFVVKSNLFSILYVSRLPVTSCVPSLVALNRMLNIHSTLPNLQETSRTAHGATIDCSHFACWLSAFCSLTTSRSFVVLRCGPLLCSRISLTISFLFLAGFRSQSHFFSFFLRSYEHNSKLQIELFYSALLFSSFKCNGLWPHKTSQFFFFSFLFWLFSNVTACGRTCKSLSFFPWPIFNFIVRPVVAQFFPIFFFSVWLFC